jgi:cobaltochelatase CobN
MILRESDGSQELLPSSPARGEDPRKKFAVILLLSRSDTDVLSAHVADDVVPDRYANPARLVVDDLPALVEGVVLEGLAVVRLLAGRPARDGDLDGLLAVPRSDVGEIAVCTLTGIARERGVA